MRDERKGKRRGEGRRKGEERRNRMSGDSRESHAGLLTV